MHSAALTHFASAERLLAQGDDLNLRYVCLELRICIELLCYERLAMHEKELPPEVFAVWQPQQVIALLLEADPSSDSDVSLAFALNREDGTPGQFFHMGTRRGISKKFIRDHYHRLSPYLHAQTVAAHRQGKAAIPPGLRKSLESTVEALRPYVDDYFLANLGAFSTFTCEECGAANPHNVQGLRNGKVVQCVGSSCKAQYIVDRVDSGTPHYTLSAFSWNCPGCGTSQHIGHHRLTVGATLKCIACPVRGVVQWACQFKTPTPPA